MIPRFYVPFQSLGQIVFAHLRTPPPDPRCLVPTISETTVKALNQALAKDPQNRFATAGEFVTALTEFSEEKV